MWSARTKRSSAAVGSRAGTVAFASVMFDYGHRKAHRATPYFDVVSHVDLMELDNGLNTARKELGQRYDFRGTNTDIERGPEGIVIRSSDEPHAAAALTLLRARVATRGRAPSAGSRGGRATRSRSRGGAGAGCAS